MRLLKRIAALPLKDQLLLLRAVVLVAAIRIALYIVPFRILLRRALRPSGNSKPGQSADKLAWAVSASARYVPGATCLTQALATQFLLKNAGHDSKLEIGVTNEMPAGFQAHAWVVCDNKIVIGGDEAKRFRLLGSWSARS